MLTTAKTSLSLLLLSALALGQSAFFGSVSQLPLGNAQLPLTWIDGHECDSNQQYIFNFPSTWVGLAPVGWPAHVPYANSLAGLQSFVNDMEAYRTATGNATQGGIPPGVYSGVSGLILPQSNTVRSLNCNHLLSTSSASLGPVIGSSARIVCAQGNQDNLSTSTNIFVDNPDCSSPNDAQYLVTIECTASGSNGCSGLQSCSPIGSGATLCAATVIGPDDWLIEDMESKPHAGTVGNYTPVLFAATGNETVPTQLSQHIHLRKIWSHGDWTSLTTGANNITNEFTLGIYYGSLTQSMGSRSLRPGSEGHAIGMSYGSQMKIVYNVLEGQSSGLFCGGFASTISLTNPLPCTDMQVGRNVFRFPSSWIGVLTIPGGNVNYAGQSVARKNTTEVKILKQGLFYGNTFQDSDGSGGQSGIVGLSTTIRNTSGGGYGQNYSNTIQDLTYEYNIGRNGCTEASQSGQSGLSGDGGGLGVGMQHVTWDHNLYYNISNANPGCGGINSTSYVVQSSVPNWKATVARNAAGTIATATVTCTDIAGAGNCPVGPPPVGFEQTNISPGDLMAMQNCTDASFNTPTDSTTFGGHTVPGLGVAALAGSLPNGLTVVYPSIGTANAIDASGTCTVSTQGFPSYYQFTHNTSITDAAKSFVSGNGFNGLEGGPAYARYSTIRDNIMLGGGWSSVVAEGTPSQKITWDVTTAAIDYNVWPGRTAASYTEYNNNPFARPGVCGLANGCNPPLTMMYPATAHCTGNPAVDGSGNPTCVGFKGLLNTGSVNINLSDWHLYGLCTTSDAVCSNIMTQFAAGGTRAASDGSARGFDPVLMDYYQSATRYSCKTWCGTDGPKTD